MKNKHKIFILIITILLVGLLIYNKKYIYSRLFQNKYKVAVIIHGFAPRSFRYTYKSIEENIINKLKYKYDVDVYHYSLLSKDNKINSSRLEERDTIINNNDVNLIKCKKIVKEYQEDLNLINNIKCTNYKEKNMNKNFMRSIYGEMKCINEFPINNYDVCVMVSSDSYIIKEIDFYEIEDCYKSNCVYTTSYNQWGGLANGFYICPPNILKIICNRYNNFMYWCMYNKNKNAEKFLKYIVLSNNILNKDSNMYYLKIRANGKSNYYITLIDKYNVKNSNYIKKIFG